MKHFSRNDIRLQWENLGFYYDRDDDKMAWIIEGSRAGCICFAKIMSNYAKDPQNNWNSSHLNLGPYDYLEIGTWSEPVIDKHWIAGPIEKLTSFAERINMRILDAKAGDSLSLGQDFSPNSSYSLEFLIKHDDYRAGENDPGLAGIVEDSRGS